MVCTRIGARFDAAGVRYGAAARRSAAFRPVRRRLSRAASRFVPERNAGRPARRTAHGRIPGLRRGRNGPRSRSVQLHARIQRLRDILPVRAAGGGTERHRRDLARPRRGPRGVGFRPRTAHLALDGNHRAGQVDHRGECGRYPLQPLRTRPVFDARAGPGWIPRVVPRSHRPVGPDPAHGAARRRPLLRHLTSVNPYLVGILVSVALYLAVGTWAGRRVRHLEDYFVAGRQAPTLLILGTLVASLLSTTAFLGEAGMAYSGYGALVLTLVAINVVGYIVGALFFGRHLRRSRALTVAEYFGARFASRRVRAAAGSMIVIGLGAYLMAVTQGTALVVADVSGLSYRVALLAVWAGYTAFTLYSGSRGVVINDTMMFLLFMVAAFVALGYVVGAARGCFAAVDALATFDG